MQAFNNLLERLEKLHVVLKGLLLVFAVFLLVYWINVYFILHTKSNDAYSFLTSESEKIMLQDTRVHSWDEVK